MTDAIPAKSDVPAETGVDGTQIKAVSGEVLPPELERAATATPSVSPFAVALRGVASTEPHKLGGISQARLLTGSVDTIELELNTCKAERAELRKNLDLAKKECGEEHTRAEVLDERLGASRLIRVVATAVTTVGGLTFALGVSGRYGNDSLGVLAVGFLLIVIGWAVSLWPERKASKEKKDSA